MAADVFVSPHQAMRFNNSKSDLAYLLTFDGGIEMLLAPFDGGLDSDGLSEFREALEGLSHWYRSGLGASCALTSACEKLIEALDDTWPEDMAAVCVFGAKKYARGNYLAGRGWHDTCNSLLRHVLELLRGHELDAESGCKHVGHIAWNVCFLLHCVRHMPLHDDRVKPPNVSAPEASGARDADASEAPRDAPTSPKAGDQYRHIRTGLMFTIRSVHPNHPDGPRVVYTNGGWDTLEALARSYDKVS